MPTFEDLDAGTVFSIEREWRLKNKLPEFTYRKVDDLVATNLTGGGYHGIFRPNTPVVVSADVP